MTSLLEPWRSITDDERRALEAELRRELGAGHPLSGMTSRALARRQDCDDVLFEVGGVGVAVVHLTWSREARSDGPSAEIYHSLSEWIDRRMKPDHEAFDQNA